VLPENPKRLSHGFEEALRRDLGCMLDALGIPACDSACSKGHRARIAVSCFVR
jgi:hypothetical protein